MPSSQPLEEWTILSRFLLQPSSLPTILPYKGFLNLLPTATRNDPSLQRSLRKIYTDLQFQRSIDVDNVRANIERECARSGTLKARLRKEVAREMNGSMDDDETMVIEMPGRSIDTAIERERNHRSVTRHNHSPEVQMSRKRKRSVALASAKSGGDDEGEAERASNRSASQRTSSPAQSADPEADAATSPRENNANLITSEDDDNDISSENEEIPESPTSSAAGLSSLSSTPPWTPDLSNRHQLDTLLDHTFHGPRGLALPTSYTSRHPHSTFHTSSSLLCAMASAINSLSSEVQELDAEARDLMGKMRETVGGLSDLRYGRFAAREGEALPGLEDSLEEGLRELCAVASASTAR